MFTRKRTGLILGACLVAIWLSSFVVVAAGPKQDRQLAICSSDQFGVQFRHKDTYKKCANGDTPVTVSAVQSAIARFDYVTEDPFGPGIYNSAKSRNITAVKNVETIDYGRAYCIQLSFEAKYISPNSVYSIYSSDSNERNIATSSCGAGYNYFAWGTAATTIFFTE